MLIQANYGQFQTAVKTSSASFNELLDVSGSSLQATCGHLLIQASYSQFGQFSTQRSNRLSNYPLLHANYGTAAAGRCNGHYLCWSVRSLGFHSVIRMLTQGVGFCGSRLVLIEME